MKLIFTKSNLPLSVLIRWFLDSDCSHFAIVFKSEDGGLMFESNLLGTHPKFYKTALKSMTVVHEIDLNQISDEQQNILWDTIVDHVDGQPYNYTGFAYFCWRAILKKFFGIQLPAKNPWSMPGTFLCEEVFNSLKTITNKNIDVDLSMVSPQDMYLFAKDWVPVGDL